MKLLAVVTPPSIYQSAGTLVEGLAGTIVIVFDVNRGEAAGRLTATGNRNGSVTTELICILDLLKILSGFF